jgi:hypothetical protein
MAPMPLMAWEKKLATWGRIVPMARIAALQAQGNDWAGS